MQALFAKYQGIAYLDTAVTTSMPGDGGIAASATCQDAACRELAVKLVNYGALQNVAVRIEGVTGVVAEDGMLTTLTGPGAHATNTFVDPQTVRTVSCSLTMCPIASWKCTVQWAVWCADLSVI